MEVKGNTIKTLFIGACSSASSGPKLGRAYPLKEFLGYQQFTKESKSLRTIEEQKGRKRGPLAKLVLALTPLLNRAIPALSVTEYADLGLA